MMLGPRATDSSSGHAGTRPPGRRRGNHDGEDWEQGQKVKRAPSVPRRGALLLACFVTGCASGPASQSRDKPLGSPSPKFDGFEPNVLLEAQGPGYT
jgi:hypothetical protein